MQEQPHNQNPLDQLAKQALNKLSRENKLESVDPVAPYSLQLAEWALEKQGVPTVHGAWESKDEESERLLNQVLALDLALSNDLEEYPNDPIVQDVLSKTQKALLMIPEGEQESLKAWQEDRASKWKGKSPEALAALLAESIQDLAWELDPSGLEPLYGLLLDSEKEELQERSNTDVDAEA